MKRASICAAFLIAVMLLGCTNNNIEHLDSNERIVWIYGNANDQGELFTDSHERLNFVDFGNLNATILCSKPNCTHMNQDECSSFGMGNHPILYGEKLYFFDEETIFDGNEITFVTSVYKAEPDGTNRIKVCTIDGLNLLSYTRMLIVGDKAYFSMDKTGWNEDLSSTSGYNEVWFCSFDFPTNTFERIQMLHEGWCSSSWIFGMFDGKVIIEYDYSEEKIPVTFDHSEIEEKLISVYKAYAVETGEMENLTLPEPLFVSDGYYIYERDGGAVVLCENSDEIKLPDFPADSNTLVMNGKLFNCYKQVCADLSNGKMYSLNCSDGLVKYINGEYILKNSDGYYKIGEESYIGNEL